MAALMSVFDKAFVVKGQSPPYYKHFSTDDSMNICFFLWDPTHACETLSFQGNIGFILSSAKEFNFLDTLLLLC